MAEFKVARTEEDAVKAVDTYLRNGYQESEITVISKEKLKTDRFNDCEIQHKSTNGTVSDKFMRMFIGEDAEAAALSRFNFEETQAEDLKQDLNNHKILVIVQKDTLRHGEVAHNNAAYIDESTDTHKPSEHKGDIE
ncbi:general stress protein [Staphylococcus ratti]|uniref:General stress protein n=1 Tax=Staphylococcus ratti TaxID=2892440 RepID=A0ABY3PCV7_9STAP|nr:general stress protein [Staphylococcus ratti]UEX90058.1 general stress protein [Staphylococcus ratti]